MFSAATDEDESLDTGCIEHEDANFLTYKINGSKDSVRKAFEKADFIVEESFEEPDILRVQYLHEL